MYDSYARSVSDVLIEKFPNVRPIAFLRLPYNKRRLNLVTDDISKKSLFGGVATALILATILCKRNGWTLRLVTRCTECNVQDYYQFIKMQGFEAPDTVETYSDAGKTVADVDSKLTLSENDVFLATSWWSAKSILDSGLAKRILYIIQEEETFFYPYGDEHLMAYEIMQNPNIDYIVNSKLLFDYCKAHGYKYIVENGIYFEPAFSDELYHADEDTFTRKEGEKLKLFFYGRPMNPRNLYYHGLKCLDEAITRGILDTDLWEIYFAGYNTGNVKFSNGYVPQMSGVLKWKEYAEFARTVDLSFSLMYTPHPSYPPFDMACSGAVVLTNEFENKKDLSYSDNMILRPLDLESILDGFKEALALAQDFEQRKKNYEQNRIARDWNEAFADVVCAIEQKIGDNYYV